MRESLLSADLAAIAEMMRHCALQGRDMTPDGCNFVAGALDQLVINARSLEEDVAIMERRWRLAADAQVAALLTDDHVAKAYREIAIDEGRRAGTIIDLRPFLDREWTGGQNSVADVSSDGKDSGDAA